MLPPPSDGPISLWALLPEIILLAGGCLVLLLGLGASEAVRRWTPRAAFAAIFLALVAAAGSVWWRQGPVASGNGLTYDALALFARHSTLVFGFIIALVAWFQPRSEERGEFWAMLLFSLAGVLLVAASADLLMLFIALELVSIPTYILVALSRRNLRALEAATKYFYLGAMSAAVTAYGFSLLYGLAGSAALPAVWQGLTTALERPATLEYGLAAVGIVLSLGGLMFKIAAVPLHFYLADVYHGAACSVAGLLGFVPKFAGFLAIFKIVAATGHWESAEPAVFGLLWLVAVASMTVGNALALIQTNIKRMLAYSGVAHSGYMLVGILVGPEAGQGLLGDGTAAVLYYVVIYGFANLTVFAVLGLLRVRGGVCETLRDVAGLLRRHPVLALLMALALFTLMGLPPTAGFWGKLSLFGSALAGVATGLTPAEYDRWLIALVVIALLNSALAAAYYLRVIAALLLHENDQPAEAVPQEAPQLGASLCGLLLLLFAIYPNPLLDRGREATGTLRSGPGYAHPARALPAPTAADPRQPTPELSAGRINPRVSALPSSDQEAARLGHGGSETQRTP